jgi:hypothetical protein
MAVRAAAGTPDQPTLGAATSHTRLNIAYSELSTGAFQQPARVAGRADGADRYYKDRQWLNAWAGTDALFFRPTYLDIDQRASFFQYVYSSAPEMVNDVINRGSKYPGTYRDGNGDLLDGSNNYKLHLPAGIPAAAFWAMTIYNPADGTMPQTDQPFPGTNGLDKPSTTRTTRPIFISAPRSRRASTRKTGSRPYAVKPSWSHCGCTAPRRRSLIRPGNQMTWSR